MGLGQPESFEMLDASDQAKVARFWTFGVGPQIDDARVARQITKSSVAPPDTQLTSHENSPGSIRPWMNSRVRPGLSMWVTSMTSTLSLGGVMFVTSPSLNEGVPPDVVETSTEPP